MTKSPPKNSILGQEAVTKSAKLLFELRYIPKKMFLLFLFYYNMFG